VSNSLAIAAVTATLRNLLFTGVNAALAGTDVTARPPDRARTNGEGNQVNLFLYQTSLDPAWRNQDMPNVARGENGHPPLPLTLYYLVTAYGDNDDEVVSNALLGHAMSILHDHPLLGAEEIKAALAESDLDQQIERVRVTPQPMTLEEMSKLWTTFQTQYRISAAYQACVVLIESKRPTRTPLPVLTRGVSDRGVVVQTNTLPPFPTIGGFEAPGGQRSALLGDSVVLTGHHLEGTTAVRLVHPRLADPLPPVAPTEVRSDRVTFTVPAEADALPAGLCFVSAVASTAGEPDRFSNEGAIPIAPSVNNPNAVRNGDVVTVTLDCSPEVVPGQAAHLLISDQQLPLGPVAASTSQLTFTSAAVPPGEHFLRLRVDGVDSDLVVRSEPPTFDATQKVNVP
jgi:Pvc16 N-terminal domain